MPITRTAPSWKEVETRIRDEMVWLNRAIATFGPETRDTSGNTVCKRCVLRDIALMIIHGDVEAREIANDNGSFWKAATPSSGRGIFHGKEWHSNLMMTIESHFHALGFSVEREPHLIYGRADLGVFKDGSAPLFIEVGTTSLYKIKMNLQKMRNLVYLIVPSERKLIEFRKAAV